MMKKLLYAFIVTIITCYCTIYCSSKNIHAFEKKSAQSGLMSYAQYSKWAKKQFKKANGYYSFTITDQNQRLDYCGFSHTYDEHNANFTKLKSSLTKFLSKVNRDNAVIFVEGNADQLPRDFAQTEQEAITKAGEMGFIVFLARQYNVAVFSPEPPYSFELNQLLTQFSKEEIAYQRFARQAAQWHRFGNKKQDFDEYFQHFFNSSREKLWKNFDFSLENINIIHQQLFGKPLEKENRNWFENIVDPVRAETIIGTLSRASSIIRDLYIIKTIQDYWNAGKSIFVVYGSTHAVMQEPALKHNLIDHSLDLVK